MKKDEVRIVLVDDQLLFVESIKAVLENVTEDFKVVGMAGNGIEAIECAEQFKPDIILMDVRMPEMDGVEATRIIHEKFPDIHIMVLTTFEDDEYVGEALKYGAAGYLLKNIPPAELISSIRAMMDGAILIHPSIARNLVTKAYSDYEHKNTEIENTYPWLADLNRREKEILLLMSEGLNNREISDRSFIAEQTVRNYVSRIYNKIGISERTKVNKLARKIRPELEHF